MERIGILRLYTLLVFIIASELPIHGQQDKTGIPLVRNFLPAHYNGHTQNFDIVEDSNGNIYVANFAGIIVYNGHDWSLLLTPDIARVTKVESNDKGQIFVGGFNEIGLVKSSENGRLYYEDLKPLIPLEYGTRFGEIKEIICTDDKSFFFTREQLLIYDGKTIEVMLLKDQLVSISSFGDKFLLRGETNLYYSFDPSDLSVEPIEYILNDLEITDILKVDQKSFLLGTVNKGIMHLAEDTLRPFKTPFDQDLIEAKISDLIQLNEELIAIGTLRNGIYFIDKQGNAITWINRNHGLQNDYVNKLYRDRGNRLWTALNNGISLVGYPWPWTSYNRNNGLKSGVVSITENKGVLLAGTYQGLYELNSESKEFSAIEGIETACWQFFNHGDHLSVATSEGVYRIEESRVFQLTNEFTLCLASMEDRPGYLYAGTLNGISEIQLSASGKILQSKNKFRELGQVTGFISDNEGNLWITTLSGQVARYKVGTDDLKVLGAEQNLPDLIGNQLYSFENDIILSTTKGLMRYDYKSGQFAEYEIRVDSSNGASTWPGLITAATGNSVWMTRGDGKGLSYFVKSQGVWKYKRRAFSPFQDFICRSIYEDKSGHMWFGGPSGIIYYDKTMSGEMFQEAKMNISEIRFNNDSIFYGGFKFTRLSDNVSTKLKYSYRNLSFKFASTGYNVQNEVQYSFWLNGHDDKWSDWNISNEKEYQNLSPGNYTFYVRSQDVYSNLSNTAEFRFEIPSPWYIKWYMIVVYILALSYAVWLVVQLRLKNLVKEKEKLENTVKERTSEIRKQKDEIQKKSEKLSNALTDLENAQEELIRQEKLASVGQMTKGIVDRIINPLNYINNFSSISKDLATDFKEILKEEKDSVGKEYFDELLDIGSMLQLNLGKIQDHGTHTVRIVKGMEELLKDRTGEFTNIDISELATQTLRSIKKSFQKYISKFRIEIDLKLKGDEFETKVINEELSKAIYEIFDNAIQSVVSHREKNKGLKGFVIGELSCTHEEIILKVKDNGMGIPKKEMSKIFDPFFTTKPTAQGSGVGLYLVREILYLHKGTISVKSEVNEETIFTIILPKLNELTT